MRTRAYIRNGIPGWPPEKQEEALKESGFTGEIYRDEISRRDMRTRNIEALVKRATMLRPTTRKEPETIFVASFLCLAFNPVDLAAALAAAVARHATVKALDTGVEIGPNSGVADMALATAAFDRAKRGEQTRAGRARGNEVSVARAKERAAPKLEQARALWSHPSDEISVTQIAAQVGLSVTALYKHLGKRSHAQKRPRKKETA